jgi:hypothetical protein
MQRKPARIIFHHEPEVHDEKCSVKDYKIIFAVMSMPYMLALTKGVT